MPSSKTQLFPVITVVHGHVKCHAHPIVLCMYTCGHAFMIIEPNISKGRPRCYSHSLHRTCFGQYKASALVQI